MKMKIRSLVFVLLAGGTFGYAQSNAVTPDGEAIVRRLLAGLDSGDLAVLDRVCSPALVTHFAGSDLTLAQTKEAARNFYAAFPDLTHRIDDIMTAGDHVILRATDSGTHRGTFDGVPATGRRVEFGIIAIYRIAGGKIVELWEQIDADGLRRQLGGRPDAGGRDQAAPARLTDRDPRVDRAAVAVSMDKYLATLRTNNADAVASWWTSDAIYMPAGIPTFRGSADFNRFLQEAYGATRVEYHSVAADDILVAGDLAMVVGTFNETLHPKSGASRSLRGRYLLAWQRQSDGSWRIVRGIGTDWPD